MRRFGFSGSHPGLRRNLCVLLTIALIVGSFTCYVNAEDFEEEVPEAVAEQVEEVQNEEEAVAEEAPAEEAVNEAEEEQEEVVEESAAEVAVAEEAAEEDVNVHDENVAEKAAVEEDVEEENAEDAEAQEAEVIDADIPAEVVSVEAEMEAAANTDVLLWVNYSSEVPEFSENIQHRYESEGYTVTIKTDTQQLTSADLNGVKIVILMPWYLDTSSNLGKSILASADVLKSFVEKGGKLVMNSDWGDYNFGQPIFEALGQKMGFVFTYGGEYYGGSMVFNSAEKADYAEKISGFMPSSFGAVTSEDPAAIWIVRDPTGHNIMMDRKTGDGYIILICDINWLTYSSGNTATVLLTTMAEYDGGHVHILSLTASDDELSAKCIGKDCDSEDLTNGVTLKIVAPEKAIVDDDETETATLDGLSDFVAATGLSITEDDIVYAGIGSTTYAESSTAPTAVGTYKASLTVSGETISVEYEIKPVEYTFNGSGYSWTKGSTSTLSFSASRNCKDDTTIDHFVGANVDNSAVAAENMTVTKGSVIVELKASYLETLSVGSHTITLFFDGGESISTTFTVNPAPKASPQTGEYTGPAVIVAAAILLAGSVVVGRMAFRKKEEI